MASTFTIDATGFPSLGEINDRGWIYTTCGWSPYGPAWVLEKQIPPTVGYGWQQTGKTGKFQGATLFELVRMTHPSPPVVDDGPSKR